MGKQMSPEQREKFEELVIAINAQLDESREGSFAWRMRKFKHEVGVAKDLLAKKKANYRDVAVAIARCGVLVRQWHYGLVTELTDVVFLDHDVAREYVRSWQKETFGQSIASRSLRNYAVEEHNGGGRAQRDPLNADAVERARELFSEYRDRLK
jgi:hypothetical protein